MNHLGPTLVSHPCLYLSDCPISHSFWCFVSCVEPDIIVQGSYPHKCGQDVNSGHLIWRWQFLLELLLHHTPMADSLHLCFPLGCSARLPLVACRFFLPWSRFAEDRIVLDNISWQFGPSSFVLGHLFLLGVGLRLDMIMGQGFQILWLHNSPSKSYYPAPRMRRRILMSSGLCHGRSSLVLRECQSLFTCPRHAPGASVDKTHRY